MSEDQRTLFVGNLHAKVTDEIVFELFLQTGPIDKVILPSDGEGDDKKHRGHAYVVFKHAESVRFASQVLEGTTLYDNVLELTARSLPITYKSSGYGGNSGSFNRRYDSSSLRGGFNRSSTWHGRDDFNPRGRGGGSYRNRMGAGGSGSNYNQNSNGSYNNYNNQTNSGGNYWGNSQQSNTDNSSSTNVEEKRQRLIQQQNMMQNQQQQQTQQQGMMNVSSAMYSTQQQQPQQNWASNSYSTGTDAYSVGQGSWNVQAGGDGNVQQGYGDQYSTWYQQQS